MAAITWRDVAAPDFRGSLDALRQSGAMFNDAISGAQGALAGIDADKSAKVNRELQLAALRYRDPDAFDKAMSEDPTLGFDPRRVDAASIGMLAGRSGQLLNEAQSRVGIDSTKLGMEATRQNMDWNSYTQGRTKEGDSLIDAAKTDYAEFLRLNNAGERDKANALLQGSEALRSLRPEQIQGLMTSGSGLASSYQGLRQGDWNYGKGVRDDTEMRQVQTVSAMINAAAADFDSANAMINTLDLNPIVKAGVMQNWRFGGYDNLGDSGLLGTPTGSAQGRGADTILGYGSFAKPPKPISQMTMGEAHDWSNKVLRPASGALNSSATGAFQITASTYRDYAARPEVFGKNWRNVPNTMENQEKVAKAIFEDRKNNGNSLKLTWAGLTEQQAAAVKNMPWEQAKSIIMAAEGTMPLKGKDVLAKDVYDMGQPIERAKLDPNNLATLYTGALGIQGTPEQVAAALIGPTNPKAPLAGTIPGADVGEVSEQLRWVQGQLRAAGQPGTVGEAALVLSRSLSKKSLGDNVFTLGGILNTNDLGGAFEVDTAAVKRTISEISDSGFQGRVTTQVDRDRTTVAISNLDKQIEEARAKYDQAVKVNASGGSVNLAPYAAKVNSLTSARNAEIRDELQRMADNKVLTSNVAPTVDKAPNKPKPNNKPAPARAPTRGTMTVQKNSIADRLYNWWAK